MLALAIHSLNNKHVIAATNVIHPNGTITSSPSSTSTSSCTACLASCSEVGAMFFSCETSCGLGTVCPTSTSSNDVATTTTKAYDGPATVRATPTSTSAPIPSCAMDKPAVVPGSIFAGSKYNVVDRFCDEVTKKPEDTLNWIVDINGDQIQPKRPGLEARSPPVTPDTYKDSKVALSWAPNLHPAFHAGDCLKGRKDAFQSIAGGPCGSTGGEQNVTAENGVWDVTWGDRKWEVMVHLVC